MPKDGSHRAYLWLGGGEVPGGADAIVNDHASGSMVLEGQGLGRLYRAEAAKESPNRARYQALATKLAFWMQRELETKLTRLTRAGTPQHLMLCAPSRAYDSKNYKAFPITDVREKWPYVAEKVRRGDLARFAHWVSASHVYGFCLSCGQVSSFDALSRGVEPMGMVFTVPPSETDACGMFVQTYFEYPASWHKVAGMCVRPQCVPACPDCSTMMPLQYSQEVMTAWREDRLCYSCYRRLLVNVKRPTFNRFQQRKLRSIDIK